MAKKTNYYYGSIQQAIQDGANALMVYTGAPQNTKRIELSDDHLKACFELIKTHNLNLDHFVVHAPYIINLATNKPQNQVFGIQFLVAEIKRTQRLGINKIVLHPGSYVNQEYEIAIQNLATALLTVLAQTSDSNVIICLETMAGKGKEIGRNFEQIAQILQLCHHHPRLGVCLDTCHLHESGYDLGQKQQILDHFDQLIGLDRVYVMHVADSCNPINAQKDRHANIGYGHIGFETLMDWIYEPRLAHIPKILETPYYEMTIPYNNTVKTVSLPPYAAEIALIKTKVWNEIFPKHAKLVFRATCAASTCPKKN